MKSQHMREHLKGRESEVILPQDGPLRCCASLTQARRLSPPAWPPKMWRGILQVQIPAPVLDQCRPWAQWAMAIPRPRGQVAFPDRQVVDIDATARPDEHPGTGHGAHREDRRQGDHPEQPAPGHGDAVGRQVLRRQPRQTPTWATRITGADLPGLHRRLQQLQREV